MKKIAIEDLRFGEVLFYIKTGVIVGVMVDSFISTTTREGSRTTKLVLRKLSPISGKFTVKADKLGVLLFKDISDAHSALENISKKKEDRSKIYNSESRKYKPSYQTTPRLMVGDRFYTWVDSGVFLCEVTKVLIYLPIDGKSPAQSKIIYGWKTADRRKLDYGELFCLEDKLISVIDSSPDGILRPEESLWAMSEWSYVDLLTY